MHKTKRVAVITALATIACTALFYRIRTRVAQTDGAPPSTAQTIVTLTSTEPPTPDQADGKSRSGRNAITASISIQIEDMSGKPIADAQASWLEQGEQALATRTEWPRQTWNAIDNATRYTLTDIEGLVTYDDWVTRPSGAADPIWISHPRFRAVGVDLATIANTSGRRLTLKMESADGTEVTVLGVDGKPIPNAIVHLQFAINSSDRASLDAAQIGLRRAFHRSASTDEEGKARLPSLSGASLIYAESGEMRSMPWRGTDEPKVELVLAPFCQAYGQVFLQGGDPPIPNGVIWVSADLGEVWNPLGRFPVALDGSWGPVRLPVIPADRYVFRLDDTPYVLDGVYLPPPTPGQALRVDIHPQLGIDIDLRVLDTSGKELRNSSATAYWRNGEHIEEKAGTTSQNGLLHFAACKVGDINFAAEHPGFVSASTDWLTVKRMPSEPIAITLSPAATLKGKCTHGGAPVRDFDIIYWTTSAGKGNIATFNNTAHGEFSLESVPVGEVSLCAVSSSLPRSATSTVNITMGGQTTVELKLPDPLPGHGRVVDGTTNEPLGSATVQMWTSQAGWDFLRWKGLQPVNAAGEFDLSGFIVGYNAIDVSAPGYTSTRGGAWGSAGSTVDFGTLTVWKGRSIVAKIDADPSTDISRYYFEGIGSVRTAPAPFPASREARSNPMAPGLVSGKCYFPGQITVERTTTLKADEDVQMTFRARAVRPLKLTVIPEPSQKLPPLMTARAHYWEGTDQVDIIVPVNSWDNTDLSFIESTRFSLEIYDYATEQLFAHTNISEAEVLSGQLTVHLGGKIVYVQVVDSDKQPIRDVFTTITFPSTASQPWQYSARSNAQGRAVFAGVTFEKSNFMLADSIHGTTVHLDIPLDSSEDNPIQLVLDANGRVEVQLLDGSQPLSPVDTMLMNAVNLMSARGVSGTNGEMSFKNLGVGDLTLVVDQAGYWPVRVPVRAELEPTKTIVQVRRLGSLRVLATRGGLPWTGVAVDLDSAEFVESARTWAGAGRIFANPTSLTTDSNGQIRFEGLPHGSYRVRVTSPDGASFQADVTVKPGQVVEQTVAAQ